MSTKSIGVVFITHNARHHLDKSLRPVMDSPLVSRVLVVNSSSGDGTIEYAKELGAEVMVIPRGEFNHGATRELARKYIGTDIVIMMTPDAYPTSSDFIKPLIKPLLEGISVVSYARQIPHIGADFFESFPREFNYPIKSHVRSINDEMHYGTYTFFCSDTCAAWLNQALDEIGGFSTVLTAEDTIAVARLLREKNYKISYVADAVVYHSHRYTLTQEFRRYFDTGYLRSKNKELLFCKSSDENHGAKFATKMFIELLCKNPIKIPYAMIHILVKYAGYKIGFYEHYLPQKLVQYFSSQDYYWNSIHANK